MVVFKFVLNICIMEKFVTIIILLTTAWNVVFSCPGICFCNLNTDGEIQASCVSASLTSVPDGFSSSTFHLSLQGNKISVINASDFSNLGELKTLDLSSNIIERIDKTAFHPLAKLTLLDLQNNKMYSLEATHFQTLTNLETLNIGTNPNLVLQGPCTLSTLVNLKKISLTYSAATFGLDIFGNSTSCSEYNCITLTGSLMCHLPVLDELDISYTATENVPVELFRLTPSLRILSLAGNKLREIPGGSFIDLTGLEQLSLNDNNLTYVNRETFNGTSKLTKLELGNEYLVVDPDSFDDMPKLSELSLTLLGQSVVDSLAPVVANIGITKLSLHHNFLTSVPVSMSHISTLISLDLSENLLTNLTGREFSTKLTELDLSNNLLETLDVYAFWGLTRITTLSLCNNHLQAVPATVFVSLSSTAKICLGNNPWLCSCEMRNVITDQRHNTFPRPSCSSPLGLQGRPFSTLSDSDVCPVTTVTRSNPTAKQTTQLTVTPKTGIPISSTTFKTSILSTTVSTSAQTLPSRHPSGASTFRTEPKHSTVRTMSRKTDLSATTTVAGGISPSISTITLIIVLILVPTVLSILILVVCLHIRQQRKPNQRVSNFPNGVTNAQCQGDGPVQDQHLSYTSQRNGSFYRPHLYEEIPDGHNGPNYYLEPRPAPLLVDPDISVISNSRPNSIYLHPPPPYKEVVDRPAADYETTIAKENQTNPYDTKISEL